MTEKDGYCGYVGGYIYKAFVIEDNFQLDEMKQLIMDRFDISSTTYHISLCNGPG